MMEKRDTNRRIILVSNRLPVTVLKGPEGLDYRPSPGGLATGLDALRRELETVWVGWPGRVANEDRDAVGSVLAEKFRCHPVFLPERLVQKYYEGYSNRTIWPIFHSFSSYARFSETEWDAYRRANVLFAQKILEVYRPGDVVWIHDYQLMLLPKLLRDRSPTLSSGFFLHIPFPNFEIFRLMPQHREILTGLLGSDLIGFHTHDYAQSFLGTVRRLTGVDTTLGQLIVEDHFVQVDVFPMGIEFGKFNEATLDPGLRPEIEPIQASLRGSRTVFSVSRLDYTKGLPESMHAIEEFLMRYPEWHGKVRFLIVVVPSRENVDRYASLKREIDELSGRINGRFGTIGWQPVRYIYRSLSFGELIGLYSSADVALITPLRDGMNLIAKEYLASKRDGDGVLILSELAGASKELVEAITVNPHSREELTQAIHRALNMPLAEQQTRNRPMRERLEAHDIHHWVRQFLDRLASAREASEILAVKYLDAHSRHHLVGEYRSADTRLLILDYDGTLVPFARTPEAAVPDAHIMATLRRLSAPETNHVVILSGRDRHTLGAWLGDLDVTMVAEHGGWVRNRGSAEWQATGDPSINEWKKEIRPTLELFVSRIPGSNIEEKDYSLVWHYRGAEQESASAAARELLDNLSAMLANLNIQVLTGACTLEVRTTGIGKGVFYANHLGLPAPDFILAMGDDTTDEDLFAALPETAFSIKVGPRMSRARFNLRNVPEARALLDVLAGAHHHRHRVTPAHGADHGIISGRR